MRIQEYGKTQDPTVLLLDKGYSPMDQEVSEHYHIIQVCLEQASSETEWNEFSGSICDRYHGDLFAIASVADEWGFARKLLLNEAIRCDQTIIESKQETPRHFIEESLLEAAKCQAISYQE